MRLKSFITAAVVFAVLLMPVTALFSEGDITQRDIALLEALADAKERGIFDEVFNRNKDSVTFEWIENAFHYSDKLSRGTLDDMKRASAYLNAIVEAERKASIFLFSDDCLLSLGDIALRISNNALAAKRYNEAMSLCKQEDDIIGEANCILRLGDLALKTSDNALAEERYKEAIPLYRQMGDVIGEANCILRLGEIAFSTSDKVLAEKRYNEAIPLYKQVGDIIGEANCILRLGDIALRTSDNATAEKRYKESMSLFKQAGDVIGEANCIMSLGEIAFWTSDNTLAEKRYKESMSLFKQAGGILGEANCIYLLGKIAFRRSDNATAEKKYKEAMSLYKQVRDILGETNCIFGLGDIAYRTSDYSAAEKKYSKATEMYASILDTYSLVISENGRARALIELKKYSEAETALESAVKAGLSTRSRAGTAADRLRYQENIGGSLKSTIFMLAPHDPQGALELFERMRGRGFLESLNSRNALLSSGITEKDFKEWDRLSDEKGKSTAFYKSLLDNKKTTDTQKDNALQKVRTAEKDLEGFEERLALQYPRYRALRGSSEDTLETSAASLSDGETAVIFIVSGDGTGAWIVTKKDEGFTCQFTECGIKAAELSESIGTLRYTVTGKDSDRGMEVEEESRSDKTGMETIKSLLSKVMLQAGTEFKSLIIVPDGGLGLVPWEAVEWKGKPLVYSSPVSYAPTLSILGLLRSSERDYSNTDRLPMAAFGGAYYDGLSGQGETVIAMLDPSARQSRLTDIMTRGYRESGWDDLPGAREEAIRVSSEYYEKKGDRDAALFSGIWASENAVKTLNTGLASKNISGRSVKLDAFRIIHFSTHGEAVPDFPETSRLVLTQPEAIPETEKGFMTQYFPGYMEEDGSLLAAEIIGLSTRADLVVLSACETGKGKVTATEGIVGLTRSWMVTGANGVVVSLWKVSDTGTRVFMTIFHRMVARGVEPKEALSRTQKLLESGKWKTGEFAPDKTYTLNGREFRYAGLDLSSPFYWAAFQYWGK